MRKPFINVDEVQLAPHPMPKPGGEFEARFAQIAMPLGATKLGCNLTVVAPGKKAWPHHVHHANDEMFVILAGEGTLRFGAERYPVRAGDIIVCPAGNAERAHQLINTSAAELRLSFDQHQGPAGDRGVSGQPQGGRALDDVGPGARPRRSRAADRPAHGTASTITTAESLSARAARCPASACSSTTTPGRRSTCSRASA